MNKKYIFLILTIIFTGCGGFRGVAESRDCELIIYHNPKGCRCLGNELFVPKNLVVDNSSIKIDKNSAIVILYMHSDGGSELVDSGIIEFKDGKIIVSLNGRAGSAVNGIYNYNLKK